MIKCERAKNGETVLEAQGDAMTLAADCAPSGMWTRPMTRASRKA